MRQRRVSNEPLIAAPRRRPPALAEMVGTTRSRVNFFMKGFRKLGFIAYNGKLEVHSSLPNVILHDWADLSSSRLTSIRADFPRHGAERPPLARGFGDLAGADAAGADVHPLHRRADHHTDAL